MKHTEATQRSTGSSESNRLQQTTRKALTDSFKRAFRNHAGGVGAITADAGFGPVHMTVTSISSVSVDPPVLAFSVSDASSSAPTLLAATTMVVHLFSEDDLHIAKLGATSGIDRFADQSLWVRLPSGEPCFPSAAVRVRVRPVSKSKVGRATLICAEALGLESHDYCEQDRSPPRRPLIYYNGGWYRLSEGDRLL